MHGYFRLIRRKLRDFDKQVFSVWGFTGLWNYVSTVLGLSIVPFFNFQLIVTASAAWLLWISKWIWDPPFGAILIFAMTLINAYFEFRVAKKIKKESFTFKRISHTFSIICTDLLIMAIINMAINIYSYYEPLADILFGWYFTNKIRQILYNMTILKLQQGGLARVLKQYVLQFLKSKMGSDVLRSLQHDGQDDDQEAENKTDNEDDNKKSLKDKDNEHQ